MNFLSLFFSPKVILVIIITAVLGLGSVKIYSSGKTNGAVAVQQKWDTQEKLRSIEIAKVLEDTHNKTKQLQIAAYKQKEKYDQKINALNKSLAVAISRVSNRTDRPADNSASGKSPSSESAPSCTGAQLFRSDAEFLIRESARANEIVILLEQCQKQYSEVEKLINGN